MIVSLVAGRSAAGSSLISVSTTSMAGSRSSTSGTANTSPGSSYAVRSSISACFFSVPGGPPSRQPRASSITGWQALLPGQASITLLPGSATHWQAGTRSRRQGVALGGALNGQPARHHDDADASLGRSHRGPALTCQWSKGGSVPGSRLPAVNLPRTCSHRDRGRRQVERSRRGRKAMVLQVRCWHRESL